MHPRTSTLIVTILAAASLRLVPHLPNVTPIAALALFGGAQFADKRLAFGVPLAALFLSDLVLGLHAGMVSVYGSFALIVGLGLLIRRRRSAAWIASAALVGSLLFFAITNFTVWAAGTWYPHTTAGLAECYVAALPFFRNELLGDLGFNALLFGGFALAQRRWTQLSDSATA